MLPTAYPSECPPGPHITSEHDIPFGPLAALRLQPYAVQPYAWPCAAVRSITLAGSTTGIPCQHATRLLTMLPRHLTSTHQHHRRRRRLFAFPCSITLIDLNTGAPRIDAVALARLLKLSGAGSGASGKAELWRASQLPSQLNPSYGLRAYALCYAVHYDAVLTFLHRCLPLQTPAPRGWAPRRLPTRTPTCAAACGCCRCTSQGSAPTTGGCGRGWVRGWVRGCSCGAMRPCQQGVGQDRSPEGRRTGARSQVLLYDCVAAASSDWLLANATTSMV